LMTGMSVPVYAFDQSKMYVGGGVSSNELDVSHYDRAIGFQGFAGYDLSDLVPLGEQGTFAVEAGYMTSGDFEFDANWIGWDINLDGLWATAVIGYRFNDAIQAIGRLGVDVGDDDGLMFGGGGAYQFHERVSIRGEYVVRQNYSSLQANVVYSF